MSLNLYRTRMSILLLILRIVRFSNISSVIWLVKTGRKNVKAWLPNAQIKRAKASPDQNEEYCSKDGKFTEYGTLPKSTNRGSRFKEVKFAVSRPPAWTGTFNGSDITDIKSSSPGLYLHYNTTLESVFIEI